MKDEELYQRTNPTEGGRDVMGTLRGYLRYWYLFILGMALFAALAYLHIRYQTVPQYKISSTLFLKDNENGSSQSAVFSELELFGSSRNIEDEIGILKSSGLMHRVLKELDLRVHYCIEGTVNDVEIYGNDLPIKVLINEAEPLTYGVPVSIVIKGRNRYQLVQDNGDGPKKVSSHRFGQEVQKPYGTFTVVANIDKPVPGKPIVFNFENLSALAGRYSSRLSISSVNSNGNLLNISLVDPIPAKGRDIINKLIEVYNIESVEDKNQLVKSTIELIDERLRLLTSELTDVEKNVELYKQQHDLTDVNSEAQLYLQQASQYNSQLAEYDIQIDILSSIERYLQKPENEMEMVPSSLNISDPTLVGLISKFNELQLERKRLLRTTQKNNPLVVDIEDQLGNLRNNIIENLKNIKDGLVITKRNIRASSRRFESQIEKVPSIERELLEISRQQSIKEGLYLYLLQKREEAALSLAAPVSNSRIIEPAGSSGQPVSPNEKSIYLGAILLGLGLPFAGIYLKEAVNDRIRTNDEVKSLTQVPILGDIAHDDYSDGLSITEKSTTEVAELFRLVRYNMRFANIGSSNKVILVTSSMKGEGKTFFARNFGASLALSGKKVVVMDFDLRTPKLFKELKLEQRDGITDYVVQPNLPVEEMLVAHPDVDNLYFIGAGPVPPNPGEMILSDKIQKLLRELKSRFDYILIDSAPIGKVADAYGMAAYVDTTLYVVRYNYTRRSQITIIEDIFRTRKLGNPMIIMNDAKQGSGGTYGYGYGNKNNGSKRRERRNRS